MSTCEYESCENTATHYDAMDSKGCEQCMEREVEDGSAVYEEFERILSPDEQALNSLRNNPVAIRFAQAIIDNHVMAEYIPGDDEWQHSCVFCEAPNIVVWDRGSVTAAQIERRLQHSHTCVVRMAQALLKTVLAGK